MVELKYMKGEEFVRKILSGKRDFSRITLEKKFDLSGYEGFGGLQHYLRNQNLAAKYIILDGSELKFIKARGLYLPYVRGRGADLRGADFLGANLGRGNFLGADLREADLREADLWGAILWGADLREADLREADFEGANLRGADLRESNFERANLWGAILWGADLRNIKNLEQALGLSYANYYETKVTKKEKAIIEKALRRKKLFVVG